MRSADFHDAASDPGVVVLDPAQSRHVVGTVRVEAGGDEDELRAESVERGTPHSSNASRSASPWRRGEPHVRHVGGERRSPEKGYRSALERGHHEHALVAARMSSEPLPWWTSKSHERHALEPRWSSAWRIPTATLLKMQKPIGRRRVA
jgi:hypothetical protein